MTAAEQLPCTPPPIEGVEPPAPPVLWRARLRQRVDAVRARLRPTPEATTTTPAPSTTPVDGVSTLAEWEEWREREEARIAELKRSTPDPTTVRGATLTFRHGTAQQYTGPHGARISAAIGQALEAQAQGYREGERPSHHLLASAAIDAELRYWARVDTPDGRAQAARVRAVRDQLEVHLGPDTVLIPPRSSFNANGEPWADDAGDDW